MQQAGAIVYVVDDDAGVRQSIVELLASHELDAVAFESGVAYLEYPRPESPACLVLDLEMPDMSGLDLQRQLGTGDHPPIVFVTGRGDIPASVLAIKAGAVDFLTKPFREAELIRAVQAAIAMDVGRREQRARQAVLELRLASLTPRERELFPLVASGLLNKQVAAELGISEVTMQIHRGRIMRKMGAESLAELVRFAGVLGIPMSRSRREH